MLDIPQHAGCFFLEPPRLAVREPWTAREKRWQEASHDQPMNASRQRTRLIRNTDRFQRPEHRSALPSRERRCKTSLLKAQRLGFSITLRAQTENPNALTTSGSQKPVISTGASAVLLPQAGPWTRPLGKRAREDLFKSEQSWDFFLLLKAADSYAARTS